MFQHSFTFLVLAACLKFMPVCVDLLFDFRFGSVRFIFLPGRCVRKRTIGHQLVNEEGKVDGETPPSSSPSTSYQQHQLSFVRLGMLSTISPVANET